MLLIDSEDVDSIDEDKCLIVVRLKVHKMLLNIPLGSIK